MVKPRDTFKSQREVRAACYKARLVLRRKTATLEEMRAACCELNKVVRTLQGWIQNGNYYRRCRAEGMSFAHERAHREMSGPLIPLTCKDPATFSGEPSQEGFV